MLAIGASSIMAAATEETEDIVSISSSSLVIKIRALSEKWLDSMLLAAKKAKEINTPFVFHSVGAGALKYRTETALKIIATATQNIIRGTALEIMVLAQQASE